MQHNLSRWCRVHVVLWCGGCITSSHAGVAYTLCYGLETCGGCTTSSHAGVAYTLCYGLPTQHAPHRVDSFGVSLCAGAPGCNCSLDSCVVMAVPPVTSSRPRRASTPGMLGFLPPPPGGAALPLLLLAGARAHGAPVTSLAWLCMWNPCGRGVRALSGGYYSSCAE